MFIDFTEASGNSVQLIPHSNTNIDELSASIFQFQDTHWKDTIDDSTHNPTSDDDYLYALASCGA